MRIHDNVLKTLLGWWQSWFQETVWGSDWMVQKFCTFCTSLFPELLNSPVSISGFEATWCSFFNRDCRVTEPHLLDPNPYVWGLLKAICPLVRIDERTKDPLLGWWQSWFRETVVAVAGWVRNFCTFWIPSFPKLSNSPAYFLEWGNLMQFLV